MNTKEIPKQFYKSAKEEIMYHKLTHRYYNPNAFVYLVLFIAIILITMIAISIIEPSENSALLAISIAFVFPIVILMFFDWFYFRTTFLNHKTEYTFETILKLAMLSPFKFIKLFNVTTEEIYKKEIYKLAQEKFEENLQYLENRKKRKARVEEELNDINLKLGEAR